MSKKDISFLNSSLPSSENDILYPTGFFEFDMQNGYKSYNPITEKYDYNMGIVDGSMTMVIGRSNAGKSTFALQVAGNIIRDFDHGKIIHIDLEQGCSNDSKNKALLKMGDEDYCKKYIRYNSNITIETLEALIEKEMQYKFDNREELSYNTGKYDIHGNEIIKLQPTVVLVDAVPQLISDKIMNSNVDDRTNMDSATNINVLNSFSRKYVQKIKSYNIIFIFINHIRKGINTSFIPKKSDMPGLKQDESLPGGSALKYVIGYLIRLDDTTPKFSDGEEFGISGCYVKVSAAKTRQGKLNNESKLFFGGAHGFIDYLSNFSMLKERGLISQSGAYFSVPGYDKKVTKKQIIELYNNDESFRNTLNKLTAECVINTINSFDDINYITGMESINNVLSYLT